LRAPFLAELDSRGEPLSRLDQAAGRA